MRRGRDHRSEFGFGQVPEAVFSSDESLTRQALKTGLNAYLFDTGIVGRRCGSVVLTQLLGNPGLRMREVRRSDGERRLIIMRNGALVVRDLSGINEFDVAAPWTTSNVRTMTVTASEDAVYFAAPEFSPRKLEFQGGSWQWGEIEFEEYPDGAIAQPYHRFEDDGVTVQSSATSGAGVTLTFSSAILTNDHVGTRIQIYDQDVEIVSVTGATATANIIGTLYPTWRVSVASSAGYAVGDVVAGETTQIRGEVVGVGAGFVDVTNTQGYDNFDAAGNENLIGPRTSQAITASVTAPSPGATVRWREQMMSPARGYPRTVAFFDNRLVFGGFRDADTFIAASAAGIPGDFRIISDIEDGDPFIVGISDADISEIRHIVATEMLVIMTRTGSWYVPQTNNAQFTPTGVRFNKFRAEGVSEIQPVDTGDGIAFFDTNNRMITYQLTGTQIRSWGARDISVLGQDVIKTPVALTFVDGIAPQKEKMLAVLHDDGTAAVLIRRRGNPQGETDFAGWVPWQMGLDARFTAFAAEAGAFYAFVERDNYYQIIRFDWDAVMDMEVGYKTAIPDYTGSVLHVSDTGQVIGGAEVISDGTITGVKTGGNRQAGIDFDLDITPCPKINDSFGVTLMAHNYIYVDLIDTTSFEGNGEWRDTRPWDADLETFYGPETRVEEFLADNWDAFKTFSITQKQGEGSPLKIRSITFKESLT